MLKLTKRIVDAAEIRPAEHFIWDAEVPGFGLRVLTSGRKGYIVQYQAARRSRRISLGLSTVLTCEQARTRAITVISAARNGEDPAAQRDTDRQAITVKSLAERFDREHIALHVKASTAKEYRRNLRRFILPALGRLRATELTRADVAKFHHDRRSTTSRMQPNTLSEALNTLVSNKTILVIDDFHYVNPSVRTMLMRNVKSAAFSGLKVVVLSVTHRAFDAIKAESELTGRFTAITLPEWSRPDLEKIPALGFRMLRVSYDHELIALLSQEAQKSPFLMQKFCWEICFDCSIERAKAFGRHSIHHDYPLEEMYVRIARDAGLPIYQKLVAGPQSRKARTKRPLSAGNEADIYEVTLLALAETGPQASISYDALRATLNSLLTDKMPQKQEITAALKHLASISLKAGLEGAIDWDDDKR
jgi:Arm DNA-binding domain/Phage integrase, N-terminal SAM-like domain